MKNWYFTFGSNHITKSGRKLNNNWIRVVEKDFNEARKLFIEKFTSVEMDAPDKFAFQYEEEKFDKSYFRLGEYLVIKSEEAIKWEQDNCDHYFIDSASKWSPIHQKTCQDCGKVI